MNENILTIAIVAGFIILQRWILPRFGIHTCMSPKSSCFTGKKKEEDSTVINVNKIDVEEV